MRTLLMVDLQNDFMPGGALPVAEGDVVVPVVNGLMGRFDLVLATQDWHPPDHGSFAVNHPGKKPGETVMLAGFPQVLWPVHCVQNTPGAAFVPGLNTQPIAQVFRKGIDARIDSYSGFFDNAHRRSTGLGDYLHSRQVTEFHIAGVATDYCVKFTVLDALQLGLKPVVVVDGCRGVELNPGDSGRALDELAAAGAKLLRADQISARAESAGSHRGRA